MRNPTPAIAAAVRAGVTHEVHLIKHDPSVTAYGQEAAEALGVEPGRVFKTLVNSVDGKLVVAVVPGGRDVEGTEALVDEFKQRTGGRTMRLMTSDAYPAYGTAILGAYGETVTPPRTGKPGRPKGPYKVPPKDLVYATVEKVKEKGRVVEILTHLVFGTMMALAAALKGSRVSRSINTSLLERQHLTDRHHNARKSRKTYRFSKDWRYHEAATYFTLYSYNFCWPVRTLREPIGEGRWRKRTPAMAAGLADHVWSMTEWISRTAVLRS